ncbi:hypothetical protein STEG23_006596 [Scotinomys teguina]
MKKGQTHRHKYRKAGIRCCEYSDIRECVVFVFKFLISQGYFHGDTVLPSVHPVLVFSSYLLDMNISKVAHPMGKVEKNTLTAAVRAGNSRGLELMRDQDSLNLFSYTEKEGPKQLCPLGLKFFSGPDPVEQLRLAFCTGRKAQLTIRGKSVEGSGVRVKINPDHPYVNGVLGKGIVYVDPDHPYVNGGLGKGIVYADPDHPYVNGVLGKGIVYAGPDHPYVNRVLGKGIVYAGPDHPYVNGVLGKGIVYADPDHPYVNRVLEAWEGPTLGLKPIPAISRNLRSFLQVSGQNPLSANNEISNNYGYQWRWGR